MIVNKITPALCCVSGTFQFLLSALARLQLPQGQIAPSCYQHLINNFTFHFPSLAQQHPALGVLSCGFSLQPVGFSQEDQSTMCFLLQACFWHCSFLLCLKLPFCFCSSALSSLKVLVGWDPVCFAGTTTNRWECSHHRAELPCRPG